MSHSLVSGPVVLGLEESSVSDLALEWAVQAAQERAVPLELVVCWQEPAVSIGVGMGVPQDTDVVRALRSQSEYVLARGAEKVAGISPELTVRGEVVADAPAKALIEHSRAASLIVVGSHGRGGFSGLLLGSVSRQVATHASSPVAVIREPAPDSALEVVVGVDGSPEAMRALNFAFDFASRRRLSLRVMHAWEVPPIASFSASRTLSPLQVLSDIEGAEERATAEVLAGHAERYPDVHVAVDVVHGNPAAQLVGASATAAAVVVGSRGRGGFLGLALGSVSHTLLHHAQSPVIVVH